MKGEGKGMERIEERKGNETRLEREVKKTGKEME